MIIVGVIQKSDEMARFIKVELNRETVAFEAKKAVSQSHFCGFSNVFSRFSWGF